MRSSRLWAALAIALSIGLLAPPPARAASYALFTAYTGTPAAPTSADTVKVLTVSNKYIHVHVIDTAGSSVAVVKVWQRASSTDGWYNSATCSNPDNTGAACYFSLGRSYQTSATIDSYVSGTISVTLETFPVE